MEPGGRSLRILMTNKDLHWEPNILIFEEQEHSCTGVIGYLLLRPNGTEGQPLIINQVTFIKTVDTSDLTSDDNFLLFCKQISM